MVKSFSSFSRIASLSMFLTTLTNKPKKPIVPDAASKIGQWNAANSKNSAAKKQAHDTKRKLAVLASEKIIPCWILCNILCKPYNANNIGINKTKYNSRRLNGTFCIINNIGTTAAKMHQSTSAIRIHHMVSKSDFE